MTKLGTFRERKDLGDVVIQVLKQDIKNAEGTVVDTVAWRKVDYTINGGGTFINVLAKDLKSGKILDVNFFGDCVVAFTKGMYLNPEIFDWDKFETPVIGAFMKLKGIFTEKWDRLLKSKNPDLKKPHWKLSFKVLSPTDIRIKQPPPMPDSLEALEAKQAAATRGKKI